MMRPTTSQPPTATVRSLRDVRDLDGYVSASLASLGVQPTSRAHGPLVEHGVRSAYRLERALPPETSLRAVLDQVLPVRLHASLRAGSASPLAAAAVA